MGSFVCTFCGTGDLPSRADLERHWLESAICGRNRNAVSALRPDVQTFGERPIMPGEATLRLVQERTFEPEPIDPGMPRTFTELMSRGFEPRPVDEVEIREPEG